MGLYDKECIANFKRLSNKNYEIEDYELLLQFIRKKKILVTPHILTEVSNFATKLKENKFSEFIDANRPILERIDEEYVSKTNILSDIEIIKFGFTDISIVLTARKNNALVITDDFPLYGKCKQIGIDTIHLNEILSQKEIFKK
ncbi:MAG: hypothetical protein FIB08_01070 [Candidatus Methanoperedens sp.]|nr:hypothetical protein [Candidatus Methanoperedens sp.]